MCSGYLPCVRHFGTLLPKSSIKTSIKEDIFTLFQKTRERGRDRESFQVIASHIHCVQGNEFFRNTVTSQELSSGLRLFPLGRS